MMTNILEKCRKFTTPQEYMALGMYPYFHPLETEQGPEVMISGKKFIMAGSNNYLGLANDPRMKEAAINAIKKYGTGSTGSRFLNGNTVFHQELEEKLANFTGKEAALVYATGYQMNVGTVSCLLGKKDVAVIDKLDHASILDGVTFSSAAMKRYKHNDMADLEKVFSQIDKDTGKIVIVDGVFSMEGDICNLPEIVKIAKKNSAVIMVDDAHGTGVLGENGHGTCEHFGLVGEVDLISGTFSKSFASIGGFVASDKDTINYVRHRSRSMMFSAALPPTCVAAVLKAIDIIKSEPQRRKRLWDNTHKLKNGFKSLGFNTLQSQTPIVPVVIGDEKKCFAVWKALYEMGIFTTPVIPPAVTLQHTLLRVCITATHTDKHIEQILGAFAKCTKNIKPDVSVVK
jgi:8-amino-7-oxononanoate synthase